MAVIGTCVYFVAGVSATYPPIRTYDYSGTIDNLKSDLEHLCHDNQNITFVVTDVTGGPEYGTTYAYYMTIKLKTTSTILEFSIVYDFTNYWFKKDKSQVALIMAYDTAHNLGGYSLKANGIKPFVQVFEHDVMAKLPKQFLEVINDL